MLCTMRCMASSRVFHSRGKRLSGVVRRREGHGGRVGSNDACSRRCRQPEAEPLGLGNKAGLGANPLHSKDGQGSEKQHVE